jgi:dipeptidase E
MAKFMLIAGGNVGRGRTDYETKNIDKEIVKMAEKEEPNFLFVGLASNFSDSYYDTMKKIYSNLGCKCSYLKKKNIINNRDIVINKMSSADIIYFCGGNSIKLVNDLKKYDLVDLLDEQIKNNTVIAGMSAGAIMLSKYGYSDSLKLTGESDKYDFVEGLNFLPIVFCPHYILEEEKALELSNDLKNYNYKVVAAEDKCAIKIVDDMYEIIREQDNINSYICTYEKEFVCKKLEDKGNIKGLM